MKRRAVNVALIAGLLAHATIAEAQSITPFVEADDGRAPITSALAQATQSIDIYVFELTLAADDAIVQGLGAAATGGVAVRALLEPCPGEGAACVPPNPSAIDACRMLIQAGVSVKWANPAFIKTHAKTTLIDGATALVTTVNLDPRTFTVRRDYGVVTNDPGVIQDLATVFNQDWQNDALISDCTAAPSRNPDATVASYSTLIVSPDNGRQALVGTAAQPGFIRTAASTLQIQVETLDPQENRGVIPALRDIAAAGVSVQVIIKEARGSIDTAQAIINAGGDARCQADLHAKLAIVDGARVFLGSQNLTRDSLDLRREIGWVTPDAATLSRFSATFAADWAAAGACTR